MGLLSAFAVLLSRLTQQDDLVVGTPIAGRTRTEVEHLVGLFVNTLVLRVDLTGEPSFADVMRRIRETALGAYAHQELPFEKLVEVLQPQRKAGQHPLVQAMLVLHNAPARSGLTANFEVESIDLQTDTAKVDLNLIAGRNRQRHGRVARIQH